MSGLPHGRDRELQLVARAQLVTVLGGRGHVAFQEAALAVRPRRPVGGDLPHRRPRQRTLSGEAAQAFEHRHEPDVARRRRQAGMGVGDRVVGVEDGEQRGGTDPADGRVGEVPDRHDP